MMDQDDEKDEISYIRCCGCSKQLRMDRSAYAPNIDYYCTIQCRVDNG